MKYRSFMTTWIATTFSLGIINNAMATPSHNISTPKKSTHQSHKQYSLDFNQQHYQIKTAQLNGKTLTYRAYEDIVYVANPVEPAYQRLHFYVPEAYFNGQQINGYNANNAPIFLPNSVGGYMPAMAAKAEDKGMGGKTSTILNALAQGYVVASVGARGRTLEHNGTYTGKAPAAIIDLKAAVRYLHANDGKMLGDANKIISNGTSAGGALSALLGASADSADYESALKALGAAKASDAIFAVSAYCPITNLDNADSAYEWEFNGLNDFSRMDMSKLNAKTFNDRSQEIPPKIEGTLNAEEIKVSAELKQLFPNYLNSLNLKDANGNPLTLDQQGNGSFKNYLANLIAQSAENARQKGTDLSAFSWISFAQDGSVKSIDWDGYVHSAKRMKSPPAFDALTMDSGENNLFGENNRLKINNKHFTPYSYQHHIGNKIGTWAMADNNIIKMMNPMHYLDNPKSAQYWRIRVGSADRDTSHAISAILAVALQMHGKQVDLAYPWAVPHSGDYDLDELFQWIDHLAK